MEWLFSGVLIAAAAGILGFTGYLLRRLFTTEPGPVDTAGEPS